MTAIRERGDLALRLITATTKLRAYYAEDTGLLDRWGRRFIDEIDVTMRARNNIETGAPISLSNLRAAVQIAERIAGLAEEVDDAGGERA